VAGTGEPTEPGEGTATLLYIEDNEPNVHVVEHLLRLRPRWRMIHAALGGLGIELARAHRPDLVLLDLHLPDQPGRDVLRALKRRADTEDIPVVVLSADASPGLSRTLVAAGAEQFLTKPVDVDVVLALLDEVASRPAESTQAHPEEEPR
jgi:CheY-like chemotaxis protein